jgi:hypothetical protein
MRDRPACADPTCRAPLIERRAIPSSGSMLHTIEFLTDLTVDLEVSPRKPLERLCIQHGTRRSASLKPYVIETPEGPTEVADLFFDDGTVTRKVRYECFVLVD